MAIADLDDDGSHEGGGLRKIQGCRFACPARRTMVICRILQDVRTGQWLDVQSCTAFDVPDHVECDQECARLLNLGFRLPLWQRG